MNNKNLRSLMVSNTHQLVGIDDARLESSIDFLQALYETYGKKNPVRFYDCCNTFVVFKGTKGYIYYAGDYTELSSLVGAGKKVSKLRLLKLLGEYGLGGYGVLIVPGIDLTHLSYPALAALRSPINVAIAPAFM